MFYIETLTSVCWKIRKNGTVKGASEGAFLLKLQTVILPAAILLR